MIWKDRIKQYAHRYTLTNVSGTTYDFAEVTGEVNEVGTPVNAENMNKLLQRDGDDIKDTVTTFSEAGTRANIATGENTSTIFGKIKKWFADLKPHAFNDLATALGAETDKAPTNKLVNDEIAKRLRTYYSHTELGLANTFEVSDLANAMPTNSMVIMPVSVLDGNTNLNLPSPVLYYTLIGYKSSTNNRVLLDIFGKYANDDKLYRYTGTYRNTDTTNKFTGWKQYFTTDNISTVMPLSSAAASNEKVYSEKLAFDQLALKAPTNNPTFTGTVTVPAPTNPTDAARLQDVTGLAAVYDIVIKTQAQFNAMIASPTWFDAVSVAFVGQFTLSTPDNSGVKRPANVTRIDGYNNAKITVTNFKFNTTTAKGGLWDDENTNNPRCYITDLTVNCTGTGAGYGFNGSNNTYTNCTGTGTSTGNGYGFRGDNNTYTNCTGTGTSTGTDFGYGFRGSNNTYTNCTGTGTGTIMGYGFRGDNNTYTNCTGIGTGIGNGNGFGFYGSNNRIISCTALAYLPTDKTPIDTNCVPIFNDITDINLFMIIRDCKFPQIAKTGYQQGTIWCNIADNTTMVGSIKDNVYHSRFTVAPIKGVNVVADNNSAVDITAI